MGYVYYKRLRLLDGAWITVTGPVEIFLASKRSGSSINRSVGHLQDLQCFSRPTGTFDLSLFGAYPAQRVAFPRCEGRGP
jgi:hypothetical protein